MSAEVVYCNRGLQEDFDNLKNMNVDLKVIFFLMETKYRHCVGNPRKGLSILLSKNHESMLQVKNTYLLLGRKNIVRNDFIISTTEC